MTGPVHPKIGTDIMHLRPKLKHPDTLYEHEESIDNLLIFEGLSKPSKEDIKEYQNRCNQSKDSK